jgi:hypothetical protein
MYVHTDKCTYVHTRTHTYIHTHHMLTLDRSLLDFIHHELYDSWFHHDRSAAMNVHVLQRCILRWLMIWNTVPTYIHTYVCTYMCNKHHEFWFDHCMECACVAAMHAEVTYTHGCMHGCMYLCKYTRVRSVTNPDLTITSLVQHTHACCSYAYLNVLWSENIMCNKRACIRELWDVRINPMLHAHAHVRAYAHAWGWNARTRHMEPFKCSRARL